jgi:SpoVK/Ycf46/Vps4 family AAA+-type ATPase
LGLYEPYKPLEDWLQLNAPFFSDSTDPRLIPRGLLLNGPSGTGKSLAAKHIANTFNVPLYRLDLSATLGRYVGDSESAFARALYSIDDEKSAVLLIDEAEKLFETQSDQGVTRRILSQLLWWAQEHTSRVMLVLTNDMTSIPQELLRGRRIDKVFTLSKLDVTGATHWH